MLTAPTTIDLPPRCGEITDVFATHSGGLAEFVGIIDDARALDDKAVVELTYGGVARLRYHDGGMTVWITAAEPLPEDQAPPAAPTAEERLRAAVAS